jgi:hypothetical protein
MKTLKIAIAAVILACTFQAASAQVRVGVRIGTPPPPPRHVVVVRPPVHREVIVHRAPVRRAYYKPVHKKAYYHAYNRNVRVVRHY